MPTKTDGEAALACVYAPIGLDLGGPTPEEIAASMLAEVIAVRRGDQRVADFDETH